MRWETAISIIDNTKMPGSEGFWTLFLQYFFLERKIVNVNNYFQLKEMLNGT